MQYDVTKVVKLLKEYQDLTNKAKHIEKEAGKLYDEASKIKKQAQNICTHPTTIKDSTYHDGGYDYVSRITINISCAICGKTIKSYDDPNHRGYHS